MTTNDACPEMFFFGFIFSHLEEIDPISMVVSLLLNEVVLLCLSIIIEEEIYVYMLGILCSSVSLSLLIKYYQPQFKYIFLAVFIVFLIVTYTIAYSISNEIIDIDTTYVHYAFYFSFFTY